MHTDVSGYITVSYNASRPDLQVSNFQANGHDAKGTGTGIPPRRRQFPFAMTTR
jgi:hypothetical protein